MEKIKRDQNQFMISYLTLRKAIGFLGIFMPVLLLLGTFTIGRCTQIQDSISHYYFTIMGSVLVGVLCSFSIFLFLYIGYDKWDNFFTNLAAIFALGIAFFATTQTPDANCAVCFLGYCKARVLVHYISAALFFTTLSYISIFLFTKSKGTKTNEKFSRNIVYRICGIVMLISILLILLIKVVPWLENLLVRYKPVFWLEWIALVAFGVSWLVKGELFLKDSDTK